ncbi:siderophore-interacting protein [Streptomyces sp. CB01881]|uniref:siderophore-interacting protein n=1 Tax=Streptomyces sp. CB01881 TaxID=2078691 RepID=UPI000CDC67E5|nr:siderophore-interacting protein [Streptomyces sp. CB01881]AUY49097.1 NADPH-dependent ferric siderophore reductase [Streptomyces sp. CB01881]TYC77589.1 siderophore-interacting protein [Streptomyces sp. CB01881]
MFKRPRPVHDVEVTAVTPLTSTLTRITFTGPGLSGLEIEHPTQWVKLAIPSGPSRAYTIRHHRPGEYEVDIDLVLHGNGPLARWAADARPGDRARLAGPRGRRPSFDGAAHVLLAADESALPAALTVLEGLPADVEVSAYFEIAGPADTLPLPARTGLTAAWLPRTPAHPKGHRLTETLLATDVPPGTTAWLAGESGAVATVRRHLLTDWALPRDRVHAKGYWKHGEADHKG